MISQSPDKKTVTFEIPSFRNDIRDEVDLIEEIARIQGYDTIPLNSKIVLDAAQEPFKEPAWQAGKLIRQYLSGQDLQETINYSFIPQQETDKLAIPGKPPVVISNPLSADFGVMRNSLIYGLLKNLTQNLQNRDTETLKLYEIGRTFWKTESGKVKETETLAMIMSGRNSVINWNTRPELINFYDMSSVINGLLDELNISDCTIAGLNPDNAEYFVPGKAAAITDSKGNCIGKFGRLMPYLNDDVADEMYYAEISIDELVKYSSAARKYESFSRFPRSTRDLSLVVPEQAGYREIEDSISSEAGDWSITHTLFDVYKGEKIGEGKVSLAVSLYFTHKDRTLTDIEVNQKIEAILKKLSALGITLRS
jgi:phenylalanyl-tRNA synthetase beta chain